jgi:hypothetical protein
MHVKNSHLSFGFGQREKTFEESSKIESDDFDEFGTAHRKKPAANYQKQFVPSINLETDPAAVQKQSNSLSTT